MIKKMLILQWLRFEQLGVSSLHSSKRSHNFETKKKFVHSFLIVLKGLGTGTRRHGRTQPTDVKFWCISRASWMILSLPKSNFSLAISTRQYGAILAGRKF